MGSDPNTGEENSRWWNRKCRGLNARVPWGQVISLSWLLKANVSALLTWTIAPTQRGNEAVQILGTIHHGLHNKE